MFDRSGFIAYIGETSGMTDADGVDHIEKFYGKDVDAEYEKDHCASLLSFLKDPKNAEGMSDADLNRLRMGIDQLSRYLSYRDGGKSSSMIQRVIDAYKADFARVDDEERFKWEVLHHYQQHWDIEADDFAEMYREAYRWAGEKYKSPRNGKKDGGELLNTKWAHPYAMMSEFAEHDPEKVRKMFRVLHNEDLPLEQRYKEFIEGCHECLAEKKRREPNQGGKSPKHDHGLHEISIYLAFEFPEKYFIYRGKAYTKFREMIAFPEEKSSSQVQKLENYHRMCAYVLKAVRSDDELTKLSRCRLDENCYTDPEYHLLTADLIYFGSKIDQGRLSRMSDSHKGQSRYGTDIGKNTILYGPPGTGKTYHTVLYAVAIIENKPLAEVKAEPYEVVMKRYNQYKADNRIAFTTFHQSYGYEEFIEGIKPNMEPDGEGRGDITYHIEAGLFREFCERASQAIDQETADDVGLNRAPTVGELSPSQKNYVFIIDEINRGNVAKIFGELITLVEPSKRIGQPEGMTVTLPYSKKSFGVPDQVYLLGTMNTADRSIAAIDTALRRRFAFREMQPDLDVLDGISIEGISIRDMLSHMNQKISVLYDREHTIGHSYFLPLKDKPTIETLAQIFENRIIPLLQEYFCDDYEKIRLVLGDNKKDKDDVENQFVAAEDIDLKTLFGNTDRELDDLVSYKINPSAFSRPDAYRAV
jgi:5-methylcytosine-specific restriction protein B